MSVRSVLLLITLFLFGAYSASAQPWQITTPRQVLPVPSDGSTVNFPKVNLIGGMKYRVHASQRVIVSNNGEIADACYYVNIFPLPPTVVPVCLRTRNSPTNEDWFYNFWKASGFQSGNYQSSHVYDASITSLGSPLSFRFQDTQYGDNVGDILIDVARETPGIAIEKDTLDFGILRVGASKTLLDSIESYGIDGYSVSNVSMIGPAAAKFAVSSERVVPFIIVETTNEFRFTYSPTGNMRDTAEFHIFSSNGFGADKEKIIYLYGQGISSKIAFTTDTLDFGTIRTGKTKTLLDSIINLNSASVNVTTITPQTPGSPFSVTGAPVTIAGSSRSTISVTFAPTVNGSYFEKFDVTADDGSVFHFYAKGNAGVPIISLEKKVLDFGRVILKQSRTLTDQYGNVGTGPLNIVSTTNTNPLEYTIVGNQGPINYEPGHSIIYSVTFSPQIHIPFWGNHDGKFILNYDDGTSTTITFRGSDHQPLDVKLVIDTNYFISAGKDVDVTQQLVMPGDPLDSTLSPVSSMTEDIAFNPTLFDLVSVNKGTLINNSQWNLTTSSPGVGIIHISISSSTAKFGPGGQLLQLRFHAHDNAAVGQFTNLGQSGISFDNPLEPFAKSDPGKITISDICFPVSLTVGAPGTSIEQNNPNPFNPTTHLQYAIGKNADGSAVNVKITLFDQMGRFAAELVNEQKTPGIYDLLFDGSKYSTGAYIYIFQAGDHVERKTMVLVR